MNIFYRFRSFSIPAQIAPTYHLLLSCVWATGDANVTTEESDRAHFAMNNSMQIGLLN